MTARQLIIKTLYEAGRPLATHELSIVGISENAAATRLSELARDGIVVGQVRQGKRFKEWALKPNDSLPLTA